MCETTQGSGIPPEEVDPEDYFASYEGRERFEASYYCAEHLLKKKPYDVRLRKMLAWSAVRLGWYKTAIRTYQALVSEGESELGMLGDLGLALLFHGESEEALAVFQRICEEQPKSLGGLSGLGMAYSKLKRFVEARNCLAQLEGTGHEESTEALRRFIAREEDAT